MPSTLGWIWASLSIEDETGEIVVIFTGNNPAEILTPGSLRLHLLNQERKRQLHSLPPAPKNRSSLDEEDFDL